MNNIGIVILSRFSSTRLPGKALKEINGKKVLEYIIERVSQIVPLSQIVIATSEEFSDDPIANFGEKYGVKVHRGSLENVSRRFYQAAKEQGWEYAVRINGDNIFMDTDLLKSMTKLAVKHEYNFVSNVKERTFPKGMSIEVLKLSYYEKLLGIIENDQHYKEHVTLYLYDHDDHKNHYYVKNVQIPQAAGIQMALDTPADFERTKYIISQFQEEHYNYNLEAIFNILKNYE